MNKVVYNDCHGGFGLSGEAIALGRKLSGNPEWAEYEYELARHDPILVQVVEQLGKAAGDSLAKLKVMEIKGNRYWIEEYDGKEVVHTPEDMDWIVIEDGEE